MNKLEKKFGKYAISNLSLILIICYAVGYVLQLINKDFLFMLTLDPYQILHGQIWRLVTWIVVPPESLDLFTIIMLYFYYSVGRTLENTWGDFRYNMYLFSGMIFTILASFAAMGICYALGGEVFANSQNAEIICMMGSTILSTYFINMSILLAFAATFPNAQILLMFVVPVRMKWMGIIYGVLLGAQFITGSVFSGDPVINALLNVFYRSAIAASLLTFVIFWLTSRNNMHLAPKQIKRRQEFKREVRTASKVTGHKCAICGRTDADHPELEFRYCSKCSGNHEYCQEHLFTHEHVK